jgi:dihydroxyacetone kinase DhaKLM complex PTS-EIIA-like component DhaM
VNAIVQSAIDGNMTAAQIVFDRIEGKVMQPVDLSATVDVSPAIELIREMLNRARTNMTDVPMIEHAPIETTEEETKRTLSEASELATIIETTLEEPLYRDGNSDAKQKAPPEDRAALYTDGDNEKN